MKNPQISTLYSEKLLDTVIDFIKKNRNTIIGSLLSGFLAYMFMITNKYPNHDELVCLFTIGTTFESGRWGLEILSLLFPDMSMPWIHGVLSILFLTLSSCLVVHIFRIRSRILQMLVGGLIVSFPSQICNFTFMFTSTAYTIAFLMAVGAVYFFIGKGLLRKAAGVVLLVGSLSMYQAYLAVTVSLLILYFFFELLHERDTVKSILLRGLTSVVWIVVALGIYYLISQVFWRITGRTMGPYASGAMALDPSKILLQIKDAYISFVETLVFQKNGIALTRISRVAYPILLLTTLGGVLVAGIRSKKWSFLALELVLLALLPFGIGCLFLIFQKDSIHTMVLYSYCSLFVLFAGMVEFFLQEGDWKQVIQKLIVLGRDGIVLLLALLLAGNIFIANKAYLGMHLFYEHTYFFTSAILNRMQDTPGYTTDSKVAIIGEYTEPDYYSVYFTDLAQMNGVRALNPNAYSIREFFEMYNGIPLNQATPEEVEAIANTQEFQEMATYPNEGYMKTIGDVIVIKLS